MTNGSIYPIINRRTPLINNITNINTIDEAIKHEATKYKGIDNFIGSFVKAYHGTRMGAFGTFKLHYVKTEQLGFGIHFAENRAFAERYTEKGMSRGKFPYVHEVYLYIRKPLQADSIAYEGTEEFELAKILSLGKIYAMKDEMGVRGLYIQNCIDATNPVRAERIIKEWGYDSVIYVAEIKQRGETVGTYKSIAKSRSFVVFESSQVKTKEQLINIYGGV